MKEEYYTSETIDKQAYNFRQQLGVFREKSSHITPKKEGLALLVTDMQEFFFAKESHAHIPSMAAIVPRLKELQGAFLKNGLIVLQTKHANNLNNAGAMSRWWKSSLLQENNPLVNIIPELLNPQIPIIKKTQYDAFWETDLEQRLKVSGIKQIVIGGVMAHLCCETTARSAFVRGFDVFFLIDGTATYNRQFHFGTLMNLAHGFAVPLLTNELC